jgi:hypothetical protein
MQEGVDGLLRDKTRPPGKPRLPDETVRRVLDLTLSEPPGEATHWTSLLQRLIGLGGIRTACWGSRQFVSSDTRIIPARGCSGYDFKDADPDESDLPLKAKVMRWRTYERWEASCDAAGEALDQHCAFALLRLLK